MVDVGLFLVDPMAGGRLARTFRYGISTREALILGYDQNDRILTVFWLKI